MSAIRGAADAPEQAPWAQMRHSVPTIALALALVALAGCGGSKEAAPPATTTPPPFRGSEVSPPLETAGFALRDQDGKLVRWSAQRGRLVVVSFLYTHCPDVCPLIAQNMNTALRRLTPAERANVRMLAISVDPQRDTQAAVKRYVAEHRLLPQFRYLRGTRAQLEPVWRAWNVVARPGKLDSVDHSAYELLVDPAGRGRVIYDAGIQWRDLLHDLRVLMRE